MGRLYKRKTDRVVDKEGLSKAAEQVKDGKMSVRGAAAHFNVSRTTLQRYINMTAQERLTSWGYQQCRNLNLTIPPFMEKALADHIRDLDNRYHGLTPSKCRALAYEFAMHNNISMPESWTTNSSAGKIILLIFSKFDKKSISFLISLHKFLYYIF